MLEQTKGTLKVIMHLDASGRQEISNIINATGMPRQTCYFALNGLKDAGLVMSTREKGKPPRVYCQLTERGSDVAKSLGTIEDTLGSTIEGYKRRLKDLKSRSRSVKDRKLYEKELLILLHGLARECYNCDRWDDSLKYAKDVVKLSRKTKDDKALAEALRNIGSIYQKRTMVDEALKHFRQSLKIARALNDHECMAHDFYNNGTIFERKENYPKAMELYKQSEEYAEMSGSEIALARAYSGKGRVLARTGEFRESVEVFKKALKIFKRSGRTNYILKMYTSLGSSEYYINMDRAIEWHEKCIGLSERTGNIRMMGYALSNAAGCFIEKEEYKKAERYLYRALPIFKKLNERGMITNVYVHYSRIYRKKRKWAEAKHYLLKAGTIARPLKLQSQLGDINLIHGLINKDRGNDAKAKRYFRTAIKIFEELGMPDKVDETRMELEELIRR
jgi:tetratricopeptide (TPR) repeat protein